MLLRPGWEPPGRTPEASAATSGETGETHTRCGRGGLEQVQPALPRLLHTQQSGESQVSCVTTTSCGRVRAATEINTRAQKHHHQPTDPSSSTNPRQDTHARARAHPDQTAKTLTWEDGSATARAALWTEGRARVTATSWGSPVGQVTGESLQPQVYPVEQP